MGLPQGSPVPLVLCTVVTKGLADMNHNGPATKVTTPASPLQCSHQGSGRYEPRWACHKGHLPQGSPLPLVLCNVVTKGLADQNHDGPATRVTAPASPLQCSHQRSGGSEPKRARQATHAGRWQADIYYASATRIGQRSTVVPDL